MAEEETIEETTDVNIEDDPELAFLLDSEEEEEETTPPQAPAAPALSDEDRELLSKLRSNPDAVRRILEPVAAPPAPPPAPPREPEKPFDLEAFGEQFEKDIVSSPKEAGKKLLNMVAQVAKNVREQTIAEVEGRFAPAMQGSAENAIQSYMQNRTTDLDDDEKVELNRLIDRTRKQFGQHLSRMPIDEIYKGMDAAKAEAIGNVVLERRRKGSKTTSAAPPTYGGPGGGSSVRPTTKAGKGGKLTTDEARFVKDLRAAGIKEPKIREALAEMRSGIWETATGSI